MSDLLVVQDLSVHFHTTQGTVQANRGVSLRIGEGETFGLMGESGCGKSVLAMAILRLQQPGRIVGGHIVLDGLDLTSLSERGMSRVRGRLVGLIPQDISAALNPLQTVGFHLEEATKQATCTGLGAGRFQAVRRSGAHDQSPAVAALQAAGLPAPDDLLRLYPHQLSMGMRQRVLVALAVLLSPRLLICDEPTTALDASTKSQVVGLLDTVRKSSTMLLISHDLEVIRCLCDRVAIMYAGALIEEGPRDELLHYPQHPYTRALLAAQRFVRGEPLALIPGDAPDLISFPRGCVFHPRCPLAQTRCREEQPAPRIAESRMVACHRYA